ncbi:hypothetical protein GCM10023324_19690 [Streptomyces youssoufiensis]
MEQALNVAENPGTRSHAVRVWAGADADAEQLRPHHRLLTWRGQAAVSTVTGISSGTAHSPPFALAVMLRRTGSFA